MSKTFLNTCSGSVLVVAHNAVNQALLGTAIGNFLLFIFQQAELFFVSSFKFTVCDVWLQKRFGSRIFQEFVTEQLRCKRTGFHTKS